MANDSSGDACAHGMPINRVWTFAVLAMACFLFEQTVLADSREPQPAVAPFITFFGQGVNHSAPALDTDIRLTYTGPVGRARVRQQFFNGTGEWVHARYVFPLPGEAAVDHLLIRVGEREIVGEIQEKQQAKQTFQRARQQGQSATLVEQERPNLFTTSVANIGPGESLSVEIGFSVTADYDGSGYLSRIPLTMTPRYVPPQTNAAGRNERAVSDAHRITPPFAKAQAQDSHRVAISVEIDAGVPISLIESATHSISTANLGAGYEVRLRDQHVALDRDFELRWVPASSSEAEASLWVEEGDRGLFGLLLLTPPPGSDAAASTLSRELILVVDTSGSMAGLSLTQAQASLLFALDRLNPTDHFNIIQFNSTTRRLFPSSVSASVGNLAAARAYVSQLIAEGGTEMAPALVAATGSPVTTGIKQIVFITDGSVGNEAGLVELLESRLSDARLFTVGLGSAPNGWFMREVARVGRGTFTMIPTIDQVRTRMTQLFEKLTRPQVTDINVDWAASADPFPNPVSDLYAAEPLMVAAKLDAIPDLVTVSGRTGDQYWVRQLVPQRVESLGLAQVWARRKISQRLARPGQRTLVDIAALTEFALSFDLLTPYTSLVAVDRTPSRPAGTPAVHGDVGSILPAGSRMLGLPPTATPAGLRLLLGSLCLFASVGLFVGAVRGVGDQR